MTPVARLALTFFTAFPVQRALLAVVAILAVVVAGVALAAGPPSYGTRWLYVSAIVATLCGMFVSFPSFMACGTLFAALSAPRTFLLLPHFRRRMLAAVLVIFAVGIAPVLALVYYVPQPGILPAVLGYGFAFFTFFVLAATLRPATILILLLTLVLAVIVLGTLGTYVGRTIGPGALAVASVVAWAVFAPPYLRGKRIAVRLPILRDMLSANPAPPDDRLSGWQIRSADTSDETLTRKASDILLSGYLPARLWLQLVVLAVILVPVDLWLLFLFRIAPRLREAPLFLLPFAVVPPIAVVAARAMQRARWLWLLGPQRAELFRLVERHAARTLLVLAGAPAALTFTLGVWHGGLAPASAALVAGALIAYAASAAYAGLLFVRGFGATALLAALGYAGPYIFTLLTAAHAAERAPALAGSTAFALAAAAACRYAALRRWRTIDWIALRPPRGTSQRTRAAGV